MTKVSGCVRLRLLSEFYPKRNAKKSGANVRKSDLFELIREINEISSEEKPIIVGSQAVHAVAEILPEIAQKSIECDFLLAGGKSEIRAAINKKLGVFSNFQLEHGFYADALGLATVVLPTSWEKRLQPLTDDKGEIVAYCAEIHDIAVSKLIAGREKDFRFLKDAFCLKLFRQQSLSFEFALSNQCRKARFCRTD